MNSITSHESILHACGLVGDFYNAQETTRGGHTAVQINRAERRFNLDHEFYFVFGTEIDLFKAFPPPQARPTRALSIEQGSQLVLNGLLTGCQIQFHVFRGYQCDRRAPASQTQCPFHLGGWHCSTQSNAMLPEQPGEEGNELGLSKSSAQACARPFREGKKGPFKMARNTVGSLHRVQINIVGVDACGVPSVGVAAEPPTRLDDVGVRPVFVAMMNPAIVHDHAALCREHMNVRSVTFFDIVLRIGRTLNLELLGLRCHPTDWKDDGKNAHDLVLASDTNAVFVSLLEDFTAVQKGSIFHHTMKAST